MLFSFTHTRYSLLSTRYWLLQCRHHASQIRQRDFDLGRAEDIRRHLIRLEVEDDAVVRQREVLEVGHVRASTLRNPFGIGSVAGRFVLGGPYAERAPTVLGAGLGYTFNDQVLLTAGVVKDIDRPEQFRAGIEYRPLPALFLRTGMGTGPTRAHFGAGVRMGQLDLDLAAVIRAQLGLTPMVNLNYRFK